MNNIPDEIEDLMTKKFIYDTEDIEGNSLTFEEVSWIHDHMEQVGIWLKTDIHNVLNLIHEHMAKEKPLE